jgi:hypothetical protein
MNKWRALIWSLVSLGFLVAAVLIPVIALKRFQFAFYLLPLAGVSVLVSAFAGFAGVGAMNHGGDESRRLPRLRAFDALIWLLAMRLIIYGIGLTISGGAPCLFDDTGAFSACTSRVIGAAQLVRWIVIAMLIVAVSLIIAAVFAGLDSTQSRGEREWFFAILVIGIASVGGLVAESIAWFTNPFTQSYQQPFNEPVFLYVPALALIVILAYSFVGGNRTAMLGRRSGWGALSQTRLP